MTSEQLREIIEKPYIKKLWGIGQKGSDALCGTVLGDGKKLLVLNMMDSRPWSHYIRVDSKFNIDYDDWERDVFDTLNDYFGVSYSDEDSFPAIENDSGYACEIERWRDIKSHLSIENR
jgi:hypothetical protein